MSDQFDAFTCEIATLINGNPSPREAALGTRELTSRALASSSFVLDVATREIELLERQRGAPRQAVFQDPQRRYALTLFTWPPHFENEAHSHEYWTVSGVLHNALTFKTYTEPTQTPDSAGGDLRLEKRISAEAGDVGYICTPCIHNVANETAFHSLSLHVFSFPKSGESEEGAKRSARRASRHVTRGDSRPPSDYLTARCSALAAALAESDEPRAAELLGRLSRIGGIRVSIALAVQLLRVDPPRGAAHLQDLERQLPRHVARELRGALATHMAEGQVRGAP